MPVVSAKKEPTHVPPPISCSWKSAGLIDQVLPPNESVTVTDVSHARMTIVSEVCDQNESVHTV